MRLFRRQNQYRKELFPLSKPIKGTIFNLGEQQLTYLGITLWPGIFHLSPSPERERSKSISYVAKHSLSLSVFERSKKEPRTRTTALGS
jgi:hypothetical protein